MTGRMRSSGIVFDEADGALPEYSPPPTPPPLEEGPPPVEPLDDTELLTARDALAACEARLAETAAEL